MRNFFILSLRSLAIEIRCLAMVATAFVLSAPPLLATTRTVNNLNDAGPGSLRQLISESAPNDTINFSVRGTITLTSGELLINKHLTISGPGANVLTVQRSTAGGTPQFRIFDIPSGYFNVTISGLRIANGIGTDVGGGIFNESFGTLAVADCTISGNTAGSGGGISNHGNTVTITASTISGNTAIDGGGICNVFGGPVTITDSTISSNTASSSGGGISNQFPGSAMNLVNSTISGNTAPTGGGIDNSVYGKGGVVNLTSSTISGNSASNYGGGISTGAGGTARNTITAKNTAPNGPDVGGALTSYGFNLIGNNFGSMITPTTGDQIGTPGSPIDPLLGQLADNGGPTKTQALLSGSPAINAGDPSAPARDQRGYVRQNAPDIGAFEFGALIPVTLANISARAFVQTGDNIVIGGLIITGSGQKRMIMRAIGPSLVNHGITNPLQNPTLELHDHTGAVIASNDNWMNAPNKQEIIDSGLAPSNNLESAILTSLSPGAYTAIVRGVNNGTGIALVEGYDLDRTAGSKLGNISTRTLVQTGDNVMIGGLIVTGPDSDRVIVRAIGPSLTQHGITNALADPTLELHDHNGTLLAFNDNWKDTQQAEIEATGLAPTNDKESAIVRTLVPGNYTAIVRGRNNTIGVALVEVYGLN
jgi:polymorphic membrane protein